MFAAWDGKVLVWRNTNPQWGVNPPPRPVPAASRRHSRSTSALSTAEPVAQSGDLHAPPFRVCLSACLNVAHSGETLTLHVAWFRVQHTDIHSSVLKQVRCEVWPSSLSNIHSFILCIRQCVPAACESFWIVFQCNFIILLHVFCFF